MERLTLRALALAKMEDAVLLMEHDRYANAYYLLGYAAELALKARIAGEFRAETIPDRRFVNDIHTHDLNRLLRLAGLEILLTDAREASARFDGYWSTVSSWSEASRYGMVSRFTAYAMHVAMSDPDEGVFPWLQKHW